MKGEIVYVFIENSVTNGQHETYVHVFDTEEDAFDRFEERKAKYEADLEINGWLKTESRYCWESWAHEHYDINHVMLSIEKQVVL